MSKRARNIQNETLGARSSTETFSDSSTTRRQWPCCFPTGSRESLVTQLAILHTEPSPDEESEDLGALVSRSVSTVKVEQQFDDSLFFFDAAQDSVDLSAMLELYPIITTANIPAKKNVSLDDPVSMLGHDVDGTVFHDAMSYRNLLLEQSGRLTSFSNRDSNQHDHKTAVAKSHTNKPRVMSRITSQFFKSSRQMKSLQEPRIRIQERGFPGSLSPDELDACLLLAKELTKRPDLSEIVHVLRDVEDTPYALCRFLRSTKFDVPILLQRLENLAPDFQNARDNDFFPDLSIVMNGAPLYAFLKFYPFLTSGHAKNGCPVNYFLVGKFQAPMIFSLVDMAAFEAFMWHQSVHAFRKHIQDQQNPNIVRMESITVLDLSGLTYAAASSQEATDAVKLASKIGDYFPETLHCMVILNAPAYFAAMWGIVKQMIDPRTAKRIQVFSSFAKGQSRLLELIDATQIPLNYGGTGPDLANVAEEISHQGAGGDGTARVKRIMVEPIVLKRKGTREYIIQLDSGEVGHIKVFTRSATAAIISLFRMDKSTNKVATGRALFEQTVLGEAAGDTKGTANNENLASFKPVGITIGSNLVGPASFTVKLQDVGETAASGVPCRQFVIVGEIS